jgi:hypothetical protein
LLEFKGKRIDGLVGFAKGIQMGWTQGEIFDGVGQIQHDAFPPILLKGTESGQINPEQRGL